MAFKILFIERNLGRKSEQEPNYKAKIRYNCLDFDCEIYTNALILNYGEMFCNKANFSTRFNGNLYFRLEAFDCKRKDEIELEREIIRYVKNQNNWKTRN